MQTFERMFLVHLFYISYLNVTRLKINSYMNSFILRVKTYLLSPDTLSRYFGIDRESINFLQF